MDAVGLLVAALAVWQAVEIWRHSNLFASARARVELWEEGIWLPLAELLMCPWCLSVWLGWLAALFLSAPAPWGWPLHVFLWGLAISRLANFTNDLGHDKCRTPKDNLLEQEI